MAAPAVDESAQVDIPTQPWLELERAIASDDVAAVLGLLETWSTGETARAISRLSPDQQRQLFALIPGDRTAELIDKISDAQGVQLLSELVGVLPLRKMVLARVGQPVSV